MYDKPIFTYAPMDIILKITLFTYSIFSEVANKTYNILYCRVTPYTTINKGDRFETSINFINPEYRII
ncbi:hypothetical protein SAMN02745150_00357 [Brevinema andersonii]|uniref:Uncharacterized protein n=1 Tax=Brevinema andersonii TaxID=34097 RepID=A0A1I1DBL9_BREAD|nr:hypothetical protein SAMN02745150_00357 [Brevinema andersonii]